MATIYDNLTIEDQPLFGRLNTEEIEEWYLSFDEPLDAWTVFCNILKYSALGASMLSCVILMYITIKFDFAKTRTNIYIQQYAISSFLSFCLRLIIEMIFFFDLYVLINIRIIVCALYKLNVVLFLQIILICILLATDWVLVLLTHSWSEKHDQFQKFIIVFIYCINFVYYCFLVGTCFSYKAFWIEGITFRIILPITVVFLICINIITFFRKSPENCEKVRHALTVANTVIFTWFSLYILESLFKFYEYSLILDNILETIIVLSLYSVPFIVAVQLSDSVEFKRAYFTIFGRRNESYNQEQLNEDDENVVLDNDKDGKDTARLV